MTSGKSHEIFWMNIFVEGDIVQFISIVTYYFKSPLNQEKKYSEIIWNQHISDINVVVLICVNTKYTLFV